MTENSTFNQSAALQPGEPQIRLPGWREVIVALIGFLLIFLAGITLVEAIDPADPSIKGLYQTFVAGLTPVLVFALVFALRLRSGRSFGLASVQPKWLLVALVAAAACFVIIRTFDVAIQNLLPGIDDDQDNIRAAANGGARLLAATVLSTAVLTPLGEELIFRGILARFLQRWGTWVSVTVSAVIFASIHGVNLVFPSALLMGLVTGWLLNKTGSIWPGVVAHVSYNLTFVLLYAFG